VEDPSNQRAQPVGETKADAFSLHSNEFVRLTDGYNARDVLTHLWWHHCISGVGADMPAVVEAATMLLLQRDGSELHDASRPKAGVVIAEASESLMSALAQLRLKVATTHSERSVALFALYSRYLRWPTFAEIELGHLQAIFCTTPAIDDFLMKHHGFSVAQAMSISRAIDLAIESRIDERRARVGMVIEAVSRIGRPTNDEDRHRRGVFAYEVAFANLGDMLTFAVEHLSKLSGVPRQNVSACLARFSMRFGRVVSSTDFSATSPIRLRPFLACDEETFMIPLPKHFVFAILPAVTGLLQGSSCWHLFERRRADFVESRATALLHELMQADASYTRVGYGRDRELDGLIRKDTTAMVVQCKSGEFTPSALRGAPQRFDRDLSKNVLDAIDQLDHLITAIAAEGVIEFRASTADRQQFRLELDSLTRILPVVVTLSDLGPLAMAPWIAGGTRTSVSPYVVRLSDLEVMSKLLDHPSIMALYVERRRALNLRGDIAIADELDAFGAFLAHGIRLDEDVPRGDHDLVIIGDSRYEIDEYYQWRLGKRDKSTKKPAVVLPYEIRELVYDIIKCRDRGHLEAALTVLDLSRPMLKRFDKHFRRVKKAVARDKRLHDFTMMSGCRPGITVIGAPTFSRAEAQDVLKQLCQAHAEECLAPWWCGVGWLQHDGCSCAFVELYRRQGASAACISSARGAAVAAQ
jgi:hypothetical protein